MNIVNESKNQSASDDLRAVGGNSVSTDRRLPKRRIKEYTDQQLATFTHSIEEPLERRLQASAGIY
jgi:hypothetical protein